MAGAARLPSCFFYRFFTIGVCVAVFSVVLAGRSVAGPVDLQSLIDEALKNSPELLAAESRTEASQYRIPQAGSLADPMFMFGYQNEGWKQYTYGKMEGAQWMFTASQMFPYPGKLPLREEIASKDHEGTVTSYRQLRLKTVVRIKELYYDLLVSYKNLDLVMDKDVLLGKIEDAALARYSAGMGSQSDVLMAQTEKYMLREKEEMLRQKIQSVEAMLNTAVGRESTAPLGRPEEAASPDIPFSLDRMIAAAYRNSPELKAREILVAAAESRVKLAEREYYPDFTVNAGYFKRAGEFADMWSLTTAINIPLYYKKKQRQGVLEAKAMLAESRQELEAAKLMLSSSIRDNYSMYKAAGNLMELYQSGLIPKATQDIDTSLSLYAAGKSEIMTTITKLKALIDTETLYWTQFGEREKAAARMGALTAEDLPGPGKSGTREPGLATDAAQKQQAGGRK